MSADHYKRGLEKCSECLQSAIDSIRGHEPAHFMASLYIMRLELIKELIDGAILVENETEKTVDRKPKS